MSPPVLTNPLVPISPAIVSPGPRTLAPSLDWGPEVPTILYDDPKNGGDGSYCLNEDKSLVKWRWIPARLGGSFPAVLTASQVTELGVEIGGLSGKKGDTEIGGFMLTSTGRVAIRPFFSSPIDHYLSNIPIPSSLISGTSQLPGLLQSTLYCLAKTFGRVTVQELSGLGNTVSLVYWGRKFIDDGRERWGNQRRLAELLAVALPHWLGPDSQTASLRGPEVTLAAGGTVELRFPCPSNADFLARWLLDDSTSTTGAEPVLTAQVIEEDTGRMLVDYLPSGVQGLRWRDFMACPTVSVAGMPSGGTIRAFSLGFPRGGWTQLVKRTSALVIRFISGDIGTITLRPAVAGWLLNAREPEDRHYANTAQANAERQAQAQARGSDPVRYYGQGGVR